jgi:putative OPT family oligopeptide transporter
MSGDRTDHAPGAVPKPKGVKEFTLRAVIAGMVVAVIMGVSYPYMVLKIGFGPNVSVVAAFLGFLALGLIFRDYNRWENNIVQTAGTSAAQTAFMCILLAAFDMLRESPRVSFDFAPTPLQAFLWLTTAGLLGVLLAVPMRQHFIVDEKLTYADGVAAAETLIALDARSSDARGAVRALGLGAVLSGIVFYVQQPYPSLFHIPEVLFPTFFGLTFASMGMGLSTGLLGIGSGMLVGVRVNLSMLIGAILSWIIAPHFLMAQGIIAEGATRNDVLRWVMWPATGMLVSGGLTALALRWRILVKTFTRLSSGTAAKDEFPLRWVVIGALASGTALVLVQRLILGVPVWLTLAAILISIPLMLVGLRVLGETNWGPISSLSNLVQGIFAGLAPGNIQVNMVASGTTGTIASDSEAIMQD